MRRCCDGETYVRENEPRLVEDGHGDGTIVAGRGRRLSTRVRGADLSHRLSWLVCCFDCDAVLAVVDGVKREEVYALA